MIPTSLEWNECGWYGSMHYGSAHHRRSPSGAGDRVLEDRGSADGIGALSGARSTITRGLETQANTILADHHGLSQVGC